MTPEKRKKAYKALRLVVPTGPHADDWLHWWVESYLGVSFARSSVCSEHHAPFDVFADAFFGRVDVIVLHGSRLFSGKTFMAGTLADARAILLGAEVNILGGSKEQAETMQGYIKNTHENSRGLLLEYKRAPRHLIKKITGIQVQFTNGGSTRALAASQKSTRGKHGSDLYVDEADEIEWTVFTSALGQTYNARGIKPLTFITSTWQNAGGTLEKIFELAEEKGWSVRSYCWREAHVDNGGHVTQTEVDRKRGEMTSIDWNNEVELGRPESGDLVFEQEILDFTFDSSVGKFPDRIGHEQILIPPDSGLMFYSGTDWAKQRDYTALLTFNERAGGPDTLAAYGLFQKEPWPTMIGRHNTRIRDYGGSSCHDETGIGGVIADYLEVDSTGIQFSNRKAVHEMLSSYIAAIESGEYALPEIPSLKKAHSQLTRDMVYGSKHLPDIISAAAMARNSKHAQTFSLLLGRAD